MYVIYASTTILEDHIRIPRCYSNSRHTTHQEIQSLDLEKINYLICSIVGLMN